MHYDLYNRVVLKIRDLNSRHCLSALCASFADVPVETLKSILSLEHSKKVKRSFTEYIAPFAVQQHYSAYTKMKEEMQEAGFLLRYADSVDVPPSIVARLVLEEHLKRD